MMRAHERRDRRLGVGCGPCTQVERHFGREMFAADPARRVSPTLPRARRGSGLASRLILKCTPPEMSAATRLRAASESRPLSMSRKETQSPDFLAINPEGKVPVLLIDGKITLTEVSAILFYLGRRFPDAALLPAELDAQVQLLSWMSFIASTLHATVSKGFERAAPVFTLAERRLGGRTWAVERYSVADIHLFRLCWRFWNTYPVDANEYPNLCAHYDRTMARPAVQRTCATEAAIGYELRGQALRPR
jgi:glutathione S-transferase